MVSPRSLYIILHPVVLTCIWEGGEDGVTSFSVRKRRTTRWRLHDFCHGAVCGYGLANAI
jgi:hypothetical protein